jgi:hypothetical protein
MRWGASAVDKHASGPLEKAVRLLRVETRFSVGQQNASLDRPPCYKKCLAGGIRCWLLGRGQAPRAVANMNFRLDSDETRPAKNTRNCGTVVQEPAPTRRAPAEMFALKYLNIKGLDLSTARVGTVGELQLYNVYYNDRLTSFLHGCRRHNAESPPSPDRSPTRVESKPPRNSSPSLRFWMAAARKTDSSAS